MICSKLRREKNNCTNKKQQQNPTADPGIEQCPDWDCWEIMLPHFFLAFLHSAVFLLYIAFCLSLSSVNSSPILFLSLSLSPLSILSLSYLSCTWFLTKTNSRKDNGFYVQLVEIRALVLCTASYRM